MADKHNSVSSPFFPAPPRGSFRTVHVPRPHPPPELNDQKKKNTTPKNRRRTLNGTRGSRAGRGGRPRPPPPRYHPGKPPSEKKNKAGEGGRTVDGEGAGSLSPACPRPLPPTPLQSYVPPPPQQQPPPPCLTGVLSIFRLGLSPPAVAPGPIRFLISAAMVMNDCSTLVAFLALVSRKGIPRESANSCPRWKEGGGERVVVRTEGAGHSKGRESVRSVRSS